MPWRAADVEIDATPPDDGDDQMATDGRTVVGRLVPYGTAATVRDPDGATYAETWARGAAQAADPLLVYAWHDPSSGARGPLIGRATDVDQADDGLHASLRIADSTDGRDALALLREGLDGLSVEFTPDVDLWDKAKRAVTRQRAVVSAVAFAARPAHLTARVLQVRSEPERQPVTDTLTPTEPDAPPDEPTEPDEDVRAAAHMRSIGDRTTRTTTAAAPPALYRSFGDFLLADYSTTERDATRTQLWRALADELLADVPGLLPPAWVSSVLDLMGESAVTIGAFSSVPLDPSGNTVTFPVLTQGPDVGVQAVEKTDIASRKVLVTAVPFTKKLYAGGQDISIQTIIRSSPSYIDLLGRAMAREMMWQINTDFAAAVVAGAQAGPAWPASLDLLGAAIIDAAMLIIEATFNTPTVAVVGRDAWAAMGKAVGTDGRPLFPGAAPGNPVGSFSLASSTGDARGLSYVMDPQFPADTIVIGHRDAAVSALGTPGTLAADVPLKAGRDVAMYREAAFGVLDARGLVKIVGAPAALGAQSSRRGAKE